MCLSHMSERLDRSKLILLPQMINMIGRSGPSLTGQSCKRAWLSGFTTAANVLIASDNSGSDLNFQPTNTVHNHMAMPKRPCVFPLYPLHLYPQCLRLIRRSSWKYRRLRGSNQSKTSTVSISAPRGQYNS